MLMLKLIRCQVKVNRNDTDNQNFGNKYIR